MPDHMRPSVTTIIAGRESEFDTGRYGPVVLTADRSHVAVRHPIFDAEALFPNLIAAVPIKPHPFDGNYGQAYIKEFNLTVNVDLRPTRPKPLHSTVRMSVGDVISHTIGDQTIYMQSDGLHVRITSDSIKGLIALPVKAHHNHGIAHSDDFNLDIIVIPRDVSEPAVFDTGITDEKGQTHLKTGNLHVNKDGSWGILGRYGPIAAGSAGSPLPVRVRNPHCALCGKNVPKRSIDDLIQLGWCGVEVKREGSRREKAYICPDHTHQEVMSFMGSAIEHGRMPRTRAHCIVVRGGNDG